MHPPPCLAPARLWSRVSASSLTMVLGACAAVVSCAKPPVAPAPRATVPTTSSLAPATALSPAPILALIPADVARTGLVATFVAPRLERSLASGLALVRRAAPLPVDAAGARDMLLAQVGLPPEVSRRLDLEAPIAGAAVVGGAGRSPLTAFTFACKSAADVTALIAALGRVVERRGSATEVETRTGARAWFLSLGNVVVFADDEDALVRAGALAIEARRASRDDVSVTVYPDVLARAVGTDVRTAVQRFLGQVEERAATGGSRLGPAGNRQLQDLGAYLEDVSVAEIALGLDGDIGASLAVRLHPTTGTKLEAVSRFARTVAVDGSLLATRPAQPAGASADAPADARKSARSASEAVATEADLVITSAYGNRTLEELRRQRAALPSSGGKAELAAGRWLDAMAEGLTGELSMVARLQPVLSTEMVYPTVDPVRAAAIETALAAIDRPALAAVARAATRGESLELAVMKARQERLGKARALHAVLEVHVRGDDRGAARKLIGPSGLDVYLAMLEGRRLVVTMGPSARARMSEMALGERALAPSPAAASALAAAGQRSLFAFVDLRRVVSFALATAADTRLRVLALAPALPMPVLAGAVGDGRGELFTLDLRVPAACFAGMGALVQSAMMLRN